MAEAARQLRLLRFGDFEVDLRSGELRKAGVKLKFGGQPFQVLIILLEQPGEVVTREELQKRLWPDTFVDVEHNLNTAINKVREVLGDSAESPRYIETLPRRGYRFMGRVDEVKLDDLMPQSLRRSRAAGSRGIQAVAVLPLEDLSGDPGHDYFADGMTEVLITNLAKIKALRVISRT